MNHSSQPASQPAGGLWLAVGVGLIGLSVWLVARPHPTAPRLPTPRPLELAVDPPARDFGAVPAGQKLTNTFTLTNHTGSPVEIGDVVKSCGCTDAAVDRKRLAAGESCELAVSWEPGGFGQRAESVILTYRLGPAGPFGHVSFAGLRCVLPAALSVPSP